MNSLQPLSKLKTGDRATIVEIDDKNLEVPISRRLMEMGLTLGAEIEVAYEAPFGGAIAIRCRGTLIALRLDDAELVKVGSSKGIENE